MIKTQIQLPDKLYNEAKRVAREREMSLAEVVRRGVEYITHIYPPTTENARPWKPPKPRALGEFKASATLWREIANEPPEKND